MNPTKNATIPFGTYAGKPIKWRVLDVQGGKSLVITEEILEKKTFHDPEESVRWGNCTLHDWLNGAFLAGFTPEEQKRIVETEIVTPDNPWYDSYGRQSETTRDRVFLLSLEEVCTYFGDGSSLQRLRNRGNQAVWINDNNNGDRMTKFGSERKWWWWLRSPGCPSNRAAIVFYDGTVSVNGLDVFINYHGVRPAMWLTV